jgi:hypothetical protein
MYYLSLHDQGSEPEVGNYGFISGYTHFQNMSTRTTTEQQPDMTKFHIFYTAVRCGSVPYPF